MNYLRTNIPSECVYVYVFRAVYLSQSPVKILHIIVSFGYRIWIETDHLVESFLQESRKQELRTTGRREKLSKTPSTNYTFIQFYYWKESIKRKDTKDTFLNGA